MKHLLRIAIVFCALWFCLINQSYAAAVKGIYVTQATLENTPFLTYLIRNAKASGINAFVVDMEIPSKRYEQNIALVRESGIKYVARIIMFPDGGTTAQIKNPD